MNIERFLSDEYNFLRINEIHKSNQINKSIHQKTKIIKIDNKFYFKNISNNDKIELISYNNSNNEVKKLINIIEQLNLINDCENYEMEWINLLRKNTYPYNENNLNIFILTAIGKLLKENKILKEKLKQIE